MMPLIKEYIQDIMENRMNRVLILYVNYALIVEFPMKHLK